MPILLHSRFLNASPTAELEPRTETYQQSDEVDMGMTYEDLSIFGTLRKVYKCGPFSMFSRLLKDPTLVTSATPGNATTISTGGASILPNPRTIAEKVKKFFYYYSLNRHKSTVLTPSYHMSSYSPDDNRFDLRPFLYNVKWTWQFNKIDQVLREFEFEASGSGSGSGSNSGNNPGMGRP